ncbi:MAG TPA: hypothetical protein VIV58_31845 [Kofleriaceae bacterium]
MTAADKLRELLATRPEMPNTEQLFSWWQTSGELLDELLNPPLPATPLDELCSSLIVALHAISHRTATSHPRSLAEVRELAEKAHGLAVVLEDTRRRMLALERRTVVRRG